jgi:hypothetical protein
MAEKGGHIILAHNENRDAKVTKQQHPNKWQDFAKRRGQA